MGRADEFDRLAGMADAISRGGREVVLVAGEAGVGKSRMVAEFLGVTRDRGWCSIVGRCVEFGEQIWPLAALRELLACLVDELDDEVLDLVLGESRAVLGRLLPELEGAAPGSGGVDRDRLCEAVIGVLRRLAQRGPIVVVVEDLHWADRSTLTLFSLLARSSRPNSMMLIGTYRTDELHRRHPLRPVLAEVVRFARPTQLLLDRFDRAGTAEFAAAITGDAVDPALLDDIHRLSEGNAFFIEELVAAGAAGVSGFPESLREVVLARTTTVTDAAVDLLPLVALAGRTSREVLATAAGIDAAHMAAVVDELVTAGLLVSQGDEVRFRHELAREVFVGEISPQRRADLHADLARSIAALRPEQLGEIARHWSATHHRSSALVSLIAAGRAAMHDGAASEAEDHLGRALELWNALEAADSLVDTDLAALLVEAAMAAFHARHLDRAIELARRAVDELAGRDPRREGEVWLQLRSMYRFANRWDDCATALARALAVIPPSPPSAARVEALADTALGHRYANRPAEALAFAEEALAMASRIGVPDAMVVARNAFSAALNLAAPSDESAIEMARVTLAMCDAGVSPEHTLVAYHGLALSLASAGRSGERIDVAADGVELARASGFAGPFGALMASHWLGGLVALGRWSESEVVNGELADLISHRPAHEFFPYMEVALVRQGRPDEARPALDRVRAMLRRPDFWDENLCELGAVLVEFDTSEHRPVDAIAMVDDLLMRCRDRFARGDGSLTAAGIAAMADLDDVADGQPGRADAMRARAQCWIDRLVGRIGLLGRAERVACDLAIAELSRCQRRPSPAAWSQVAGGYEALGMRYEEAYARRRRAEALLAGVEGRSSAARCAATVELRRARSLAAGLPAPPLLQEIEALARRARVDLHLNTTAADPPCPPIDRLGLTRRERDVLELLAGGLSNGAIGEQLFISRKTASVHVSNILRKLSVDNRIEAAAVLHRNLHSGSANPSR